MQIVKYVELFLTKENIPTLFGFYISTKNDREIYYLSIDLFDNLGFSALQLLLHLLQMQYVLKQVNNMQH